MNVLTTVRFRLPAVFSVWIATVMILGNVGWSRTAAAEQKTEAKGPLAGLPSAPGPHIEKIKALADNTWLNLGSPAADPKWGKGRGRSWSSRMAYAPDLKAAFLFGEGVHTWWNKDNNRYMDDLFVYDIPGHRWVCAYPGTDVTNLDLKLDKNGFEVNAEGRPVPVAQLTHGYEQLTYDSDLHRFLFIPGASGDWQAGAPFGKKRMAWGVKGQGLPPTSSSPWSFDVRTGLWDLRKVEGPAPSRSATTLGMTLVYVPAIKKVFFFNPTTQEAWFYDPAVNTWTNLKPRGLPAPIAIDKVACLDPKRQRIYLGGNNSLWCYDIKTNAFLDLQAKGKPPQTHDDYIYGAFSTSRSVMNYDSASDTVLVFHHGNVGLTGSDTRGRGIYIYDPKTNAWAESPLTIPKELCKCPSGFYDPELNAHFIHCAGDSNDDGVMLVYRYKQPAPMPMVQSPLKEKWDYAPAMKKVAARFKGTEGVVIHVGASDTIANPYTSWARSGKGKTPEDEAVLKWMHTEAKDKTDGWWLCRQELVSHRAYTSESGLESAWLFEGAEPVPGRWPGAPLPPLSKMLDEYKPRIVVLEIGIYEAEKEAPVETYRKNMAKALDLILDRGAIPIPTTAPPIKAHLKASAAYNEVLRELARERGLPLIDIEQEILQRRPDDWYGTLMTRMHLTASRAGVNPSSEPTPENLRESGFLLRGWVTVRKIGEVKRRVLDAREKP